MASSLAKWIVDPKKNWFAAQHMKSLSTGLRRYGLRYDDLDIKEATSRLPREMVDARNQGLKPAMDLSMKHYYLPEDLQAKSSVRTDVLKSSYGVSRNSTSLLNRGSQPSLLVQSILPPRPSSRCLSTTVESGNSFAEDASPSGVTPRIKYKRLDKTARHIMQILDKEAVGEVKGAREIPDIQPGYIIQLKVEVPENRRRVSTLKGIVIARRNAGLNTTFRLRRLVQGVGIESLFPLYSPNIKEIKVLEKKKVRRAKLYYLRDRMNALRK